MHVYAANVKTYMRCELHICTKENVYVLHVRTYTCILVTNICWFWSVYVVLYMLLRVPYMLSVYAQIGNVYVDFMPIYVRTVYVDLRAYMRFFK